MTILCSIDESKSCTSVQISRMESHRYEDSVGVPVPSRERDFVKNVSIWRQFRALFLKDLTLQFRAVGTNVCQLLTPIIFILFVGIMQLIVNFILRDHHFPVPGTESSFLPPVNPGRLLDCSYLNESGPAPHVPFLCREDALNFFDEFPFWIDLLDQINATAHGVDENLLEFLNDTLMEISERYPNCQKALFDFPLYYIGTGNDVHFKLDINIGNLTSSAEHPDQVMRSGLVGGMVPDKWLYNFSLDFHTYFNDSHAPDLTCPATSEKVEYGSVQAPLFLKAENQTLFRERLIQVVKEYNLNAHKSASGNDQYNRNYRVSPLSRTQYKDVMDSVKNQTWSKIRPHAGIFINNYTSTGDEVRLNYTMIANDLVLTKYHPSNGTGIPGSNNSNDTLESLSFEIHRRNGVVNMMSNALYKMLANKTGAEDVVIATYIMPMPSKGMNITIDITTLIGGVLFPFAFSFLIPVFMSSLVKDKFEKHLIMMEQNGLSRWTYWLVTYTFNYILYIPIAIEISLLSFLFKMRLFTQTNYGVLVLTFFLWGHAEVVLGFFLSNFFSRPRTATIIGYLLVIAGIVVALILEGLQVLPADRTPFFLYMLWPPFAFYRLLQYFNLACLSMQCYGIDILSPSGGLNLVTTAMLYLGGSTIALMILSVYLSFVLPSEYGVRKNPFFPIIAVYKGLRYIFSKAGVVGKQTGKRGKTELEQTPPPEVEVQVDTTIDEDVQAEEKSLRDGFPEDAPVIMYQLRKEYPGSGGNPPHVAVETISLAIQRNECFGLLGPNGAGKTTLISVLTGLYEPTSGIGRIAGYDIRTDIQKIHHHLGVCPQFDIQHADLTAKEHLLFYARLKGVKWRREKEVVEKALRQVNLYEARNRKSKALSGGMRRRLSVAMACIGSPDILILDEPTTGLDPASRRQVWEVIENVKEGRSVILTTHAMEEADHLCTRIGIMNFGRLRCLGTQNRLKSKFGTGYQLAFNCAPGRVSDVEQFVRNNLRKAVHIETYADSCNYKLEKDDLCVSELFEMLDSVKVEIGILDWGIKMTTLEDVFLNIVKHSEDQRTKISASICPGWLPCQQCFHRRKVQVQDE